MGARQITDGLVLPPPPPLLCGDKVPLNNAPLHATTLKTHHQMDDAPRLMKNAILAGSRKPGDAGMSDYGED